MNIGNALQALRAGWILKNPESWKNRTVVVNALVSLIGLALAVASEAGYAISLSDDVVAAIALAVWGMFNAWSTVATTTKIGLRAGGTDTGDNGASGSAGA